MMILNIALRYLLAHRRQTGVCIAGVIISVVMFLSVTAMMSGFRDKFIIETVESSGHIIVHDEPRESNTPILETVYREPHTLIKFDRVKPRNQIAKIKNAEGLMRKIRAMPGIVEVAPEVTGDAIASYGTKTANVMINGVWPARQTLVTTIANNMLAGDFNRLRTTADGVIIGSGVAKMLGANVGDTIVLVSPQGGQARGKVVGIFETGVTPTDYTRIYMYLSHAQTLLDKKNIVNQLTIRTSDYLKAGSFATQIESFAGYKTEAWQETNANFLKIFAIQDAISMIITAALLVVAAFGVLNILIMSVLERVNDIAILKSFGFSRRDITLLFMAQGLIIGLIGAGLGLLFGKVTIVLLRHVPVEMEGLVRSEGLLMYEDRNMYIVAFVSALLVATVAAVYPARRAARYDPVEVIRGAH